MPNEKPVPQKIPLDKIHDLPGIPSVSQADKSYGGLVASILLDGVKEPVILRQREDGEYQLVSGYRRRKAAELSKLKELPALVYDMSEAEALEYHKLANLNPAAPIPGKLLEKDETAKAEKPVPAFSDKKPAELEKKDEAKKPDEKEVEAPKAEKPAPASTDKKSTEPEKKEEAKKPDEKKADPSKPEKPAPGRGQEAGRKESRGSQSRKAHPGSRH